MNILLIHQYYLEKQQGGGSRWNEITKAWAEENHTITVLAGMSHYNTGKKESRYRGKYFFIDQFDSNICVVRSHVSESYNVNFAGRLWGYLSFVLSSVWSGLFKARGKFDVIIVTSPPLFVGITAFILSRIKRVPFVFEIRDLWPESAIDTGVLNNKIVIRFAYWFERFIYRKAKLINVLTPAFRDVLVNIKKIPPDKIIFIPNAADFRASEKALQGFDPALFRQQNNVNGEYVVTYVGAHGVANRLLQVIDAAERLKNENVLFLLIGEGMEKKMLREEVNKRNLSNVRFLDPVSKNEIYKYIMISDAGLSVLKKADTFKTIYSNKTFDYMSCRKPVLMAIDGISRKLIEDADAGMFVEPENPADLADKIMIYLNNKSLGIRHGENGYLYAMKHFDRAALARQYMDFITSL